MPITKNRRRIAIVVLMSAFGCLLLFASVLSFYPIGYFDSTTLMGYHASDDVLEFSKGQVTWKTCHDDTLLGTFEHTWANGWEWHYKYQNPTSDVPRTKTIKLKPGIFSLTCSRSNRVQTLKRRLSPPELMDDQ